MTNSKFHLQLQMTLMTLTELQMHTDNPDKYDTYERNIKLVKEQIMNEEKKLQFSDHKRLSPSSINVALGSASGTPHASLRSSAGDWTLEAAFRP